jgi:hypothetical protein
LGVGEGWVGAAGREELSLHLEKLVEIDQPTAGAVNKKAQHLLEQFRSTGGLDTPSFISLFTGNCCYGYA